GWLQGFRVVEAPGASGAAVTVWPGREWMSAIELGDLTEPDLKDRFVDSSGIVARVHMYRFDNVIKKHVLDQIALVKTKTFPKQPPPFNDPEPPQDNSLENRKKWEDWNMRKLAYFQSDFPQFELIFQKLLATDVTVTVTFEQLNQTLDEMRRMGEALHTTFEGFNVRQLRKIVESIPVRIRDVAKTLSKQTGIIIKDEGLKLTPEFLKNMNLSPTEESGVKKPEDVQKEKEAKEKAERDAAAASSPVIPNPKGSITMGGVPIDVLIPLLKKSYVLNQEESKLRRLT
ncbi:hypothetical protein HDU76_010687, partial [Blyttiomyces sp. JEL0837]